MASTSTSSVNEPTSIKAHSQVNYSLSMLSWRGRKTGKIGIHLTENGSNQRHVIFDWR